MKGAERQRFLARVDADAFIGRSDDLERVVAAANEGTCLAILSTPGAGASELLRQAHDALVRDQTETIPFYFEIRPGDQDVAKLAERFARGLLTHAVAFRRKEWSIVARSPSLDEIERLASMKDLAWMDEVVDVLKSPKGVQQETAMVRSCFGTAARPPAHGVKMAVLLDSVQNIQAADDEWFFEMLGDLASIPGLSIIIAGHRRYLHGKTEFPRTSLEYLPFETAGRLAEHLSVSLNVGINDQTRDLIAVQLDGDPSSITALFSAARSKGRELDSFEKVESVYVDEIFGGRLRKNVAERIALAVPDPGLCRTLVSLLAASGGENSSQRYFERNLDADRKSIELIIRRLHESEIIDATVNHVGLHPNTLTTDYINAAARLYSGEPRGLVVGEALAACIRRAPQLMGGSYRRMAALDLQALLRAFDGRSVASGAVNYAAFREYRGIDDDQTYQLLVEAEQDTVLPRVVYSVAANALYPQLEGLLSDRSAAALAFDEKGLDIAIIIAQIDSKLEATPELTEFWCDRLEMLAVNSDFQNYKLWLVAPEGFDARAVAVLDDRGAYGSSFRQAKLLSRLLGAPQDRPQTLEVYKLTIPMGTETELIAAKTIEEIAARHGLGQKATNQVKTALVEACINAAEHSLSPDRQIHLRFAIEAAALKITVSNRGLRLQDRMIDTGSAPEGRRGWGLQLMRGLMDEVHIASVDDGTVITLVKNLPTNSGISSE